VEDKKPLRQSPIPHSIGTESVVSAVIDSHSPIPLSIAADVNRNKTGFPVISDLIEIHQRSVPYIHTMQYFRVYFHFIAEYLEYDMDFSKCLELQGIVLGTKRCGGFAQQKCSEA
jgi:hypothetical protein